MDTVASRMINIAIFIYLLSHRLLEDHRLEALVSSAQPAVDVGVRRRPNRDCLQVGVV